MVIAILTNGDRLSPDTPPDWYAPAPYQFDENLLEIAPGVFVARSAVVSLTYIGKAVKAA